MTKSIQQLADELARKCSRAIAVWNSNRDERERSKVISDELPLLELLEVARAAKGLLKQLDFDAKSPKQIELLNALTNLQKKVEL